MESNTVSPKCLARNIRQILILCEKVEVLVDEDDPQMLIHPDIHALRGRIIKLCGTVFDDTEWGHKILDRVWKSCYYATICRIRRAALSVEQTSWTEMLLTTFVKELCTFGNDYPHLRATVCLYIGDLRRYAWLICGREKYRSSALQCYKKSAQLYEENGIAMNQIGLMLQEINPTRALLYFLLANNARVPFHRAYSNICSLLKQHKEQEKQKEEDLTVAVIEHCFTCFRQSDFDILAGKWSEYITSQLETRHATHVALAINTVILAVVALARKGKEAEYRALSKMFFRISDIAIQNLEEWSAADAETTIPRRRRASSSSSKGSAGEVEVTNEEGMQKPFLLLQADVVSEDEIEATEKTIQNKRSRETQHRIEALLVALIHTACSSAEHLYNDSVPSAFFCQYEEFCQRLIQFLNLMELSLDGKRESLWQLGGSTPWVLLPRFLMSFVHSSYTPVIFNDFFRFAPKNSTKETNMKNMAKLRLAHDAKEEHVRASLPLFVVPEEDILLKRLDIIQTILKKKDLIVVVAEGTLRFMDGIKKNKPEARKALRWIDMQISKNSGHLRIRAAPTPSKCAEELAAQAPTTSTVIVTILTLSEMESDLSIKPVTLENAVEFCARYDKARKDLML